MARKSRVSGTTAVPANGALYRTAVYARLSSEDRDEDTLENQIYLLKSFVAEQTDMIIADVYADNGYSGTNFDRPEFTRLMEDVKRGVVNCIVVKDLSRLGRNYIETGSLIENVFPFLKVRFVAVTDSFDTKDGSGMEAMVVSFKNLVNDVYAKDISRKIITAFRTKQRNGEYIGLVAPYGYLKSPENKNKFVIDETAAPVVKEIFRLYLDGYGIDRIARYLDQAGYDCPRKYRYHIGVTKSDRYKDSRWGRHSVKTILTNRAYIGDMVQGKVKQELCNHLDKTYTDKSEWIIAENTHEPIISRDEFFQVQEMFEQKSKANIEKRNHSRMADRKEENLLRGYIKCGCCGKPMNLSQTMRGDKITRVYYCNGYRTLRSTVCDNKERIEKSLVENAVLAGIKKCVLELLDNSPGFPVIQEEAMLSATRRLSRIDRELSRLSARNADLYQDVAEGLLDDSDYVLMKNEFSKQKEILEKEKTELKAIVKKSDGKAKKRNAADYLKHCLSEKMLDRAMVENFIAGIRIYPGKRIEIDFLCKDKIMDRIGGAV